MQKHLERLLKQIQRHLKGKGPPLNSRGIALLQAMFLVMLITFLVNQVNFEASVEYTLNSQALHRVKAYQAARAGLQLSLLRINLYKKALNQVGKNNPQASQILNMIYSLPFSWPLALPAAVSSFDKDGFDKISKESLMDSTYRTQIQTEDLLNINDLDSPSKYQRERIKAHLINLFKGKAESDRDWAEKNRDTPFEELVNNIKDWIDKDTESGNGGNESSAYTKIREMDRDIKGTFPPNRHFRSLEEVRMIPGMTDELYEMINSTFSVFGPMGTNPNYADAPALKSLHPSMTDEVVNKVISRRNDPKQGPFDKADDFFNYVNGEIRGKPTITDEEQKQIPLRFSEPCNFRIQSTGASGKTEITITAVTFDIACAQGELSEQMRNHPNDDKSGGGGGGGGNGGSGTNPKGGSSPPLPKGPPRIVYWKES